ncbi:EpsG family protein [Enterococcus innesii]|uniref:EpsG family protein n=1 Tax=Enterococcus innesii TaxID=2839759 RepID=UPI001FCBE06D|nr:EpsG family protein [Enterococcus innesii]
MLIYLSIISIASILCLWSEKSYKKGELFLSGFSTFLSVMVLSVFSGLRNLSVGIDITTYGKNIFETVSTFGPSVAIDYYSRWADTGYVLFNYIVSFFTGNIHIFLGVSTFVVELSFLLFFKRYRAVLDPTLSFFIFNVVTLAYSFSILRQILSMAIIIWVYYLLTKGKYLSAILLAVGSVLIHKSAVFIILIIFTCYIITKFKEKINQRYLLLLMILFTLLSTIILTRYPETIDNLIDDLNISSIQLNNFGSPMRFILFLFPVLLIKILIKEKFIQNNEEYFLYLISLITMSFGWLGGINYSLTRLTYFIIPIYILFISKKLKIINKKSINLIIIFWFFFIFWWLIGRGSEGGVIPYIPFWKEYIVF